MEDDTTGLFPSVLEGLETFRDRISGAEGTYRQAMLVSGQSTLVIEIGTSVLRVVRNILAWLRDGIVSLQQRLLSIDAVIAMVEVAVELLADLDGGLDIPLPGLQQTTDGLNAGIAAVGTAAQNFPDTSLLPGPETVADLRTVLEQLVGVADEQGSIGAVDQLLTEIGQLAA
ncbi:MAG: hypothetical protein K0V04_31880 [Deltaproteobacteria bacterium]|nr:hypothetical protein [Deltaproteobacteria bacterium]